MAPRERQIDIDKELNDPAVKKMKDDLSRLASRRLMEAEEEMDSRDDEEVEDDEEFVQEPLKNAARKGPLANRDKQDRINRTQKNMKERGLDPDSIIRRRFDVNEADEERPREVISNRPDRARAIPTNKDGIVDSPEIGLLQKLQKQIEDQARELKGLKEKNNAHTDSKPVSRLAARGKKYDAMYEVINPPSQCLFYSFSPDDMGVKKIDVVIQQAIAAARRSRDRSAYIDAVGATFKDIDIRLLTNPDWFYVLYWHKWHSYPKSSLVMKWRSKYGNENRYKIQETDLQFVYPSISRPEFLEKYDSKGLCLPTLRDWELLNTPNDLTDEDRVLYAKAQFYKGDTIEEKVDHYFSTGQDLERLELIAELEAETNHGVIDTVDVVDNRFDPEVYLIQREANLEALRKEAELYVDSRVIYNTILSEADELSKEIETMRDILKNGGQVRAEVETQPVRFDALDIFPAL